MSSLPFDRAWTRLLVDRLSQRQEVENPDLPYPKFHDLASVSAERNVPFVYYAFRNRVETVRPATGETLSKLPESLIIEPGTYQVWGAVYDLKREGLYRFVYPGKENQQRIVFAGCLDSLLSSVAWIYSHGNSDDDMSYDEVSRKALTSKIFATCGGLSSWILMVLGGYDIPARVVQTLTLDSWNDYDNGHVLIEVYRKDLNKWVVYDLDNNVYFTHQTKPLSLIEFANQVALDDYTIERLANDSLFDVSNFKDRASGYDYAFIMEAIAAGEESLRQWYKRDIQVPLIRDGNFYYFFDAANRSQVERYAETFRYMSEKEFIEKFYADNSDHEG